jgi:hypothetical protein
LGSIAPRIGGEETGGVPSVEGDELVENGLSSPLCGGAAGGVLSRVARSNCQTSGFVGAPAPTNNYALDVHIDVGALGLSMGGVLSVIQDVFIAPVWSAIVWGAHALVVMLEWCYTLELLGGSTMSGVGRSLRQAQAGFTNPWLVLVLAVASMLAFYNGLIRRRIAETVGQALLTLAMMAAGLWVIADPIGTVGAVGQWANQASLGTLGAVARGTPSDARETLGDSMRAVFSAAVETPWCYLEFGNVRWCNDSVLLEPRLRKAAFNLLIAERAKVGCSSSSARSSCSSSTNGSAATIRRSEELVREADTNGKLFLAFPANDEQRNSVKEAGSLLHVLCQSEDDTKCAGPTASEAEFRSDGGTFPRMIGVVLIAIGELGMALLFGLVAMHLLVAAVISLFMLLLAPVAVLAPALGDGGRALFGGWATRLLGAVTSKLIFSFLLGALLTMQRTLVSLQTLGWWTQWLLVSAFWWALFLKRHQAVALVHHRTRAPAASARRPLARSAEGALETPRAILHPARRATETPLSFPPAGERFDRPRRPRWGGRAKRGAGTVPGRERLKRRGGDGVKRGEGAHAVGGVGGTRARTPEFGLAKRAQLKRLRDAHEAALATGDTRRAAMLATRAGLVRAELATYEHSAGEVPGWHGSGPPATVVPDGESSRHVPAPVRESQGPNSYERSAQPDGVSDAPAVCVPLVARRETPKAPFTDDILVWLEERKRQLGWGPGSPADKGA